MKENVKKVGVGDMFSAGRQKPEWRKPPTKIDSDFERLRDKHRSRNERSDHERIEQGHRSRGPKA